MWSHIINGDYSQDKKSANTEYFEVFFLEGLKNIVIDNYEELQDKVNQEPKEDVVE